MIFYNLIFLVLTSFNFTPRIKKYSYTSVVFLFFLLSFIRWEAGTDWETYYDIFTNQNFLGTNEIIFKFINIQIRKVTDSYTILLLIFATILFIFKYRTIYLYSKLPLLSLIMNFSYYRGDIFFVRQQISIALTLFSISYIFKKKKLKFIACILLATGFHKSAIIFVLAYAVNYINVELLNRKKYLITVVLLILLSIKAEAIILSLTNYLPNIYANKVMRYYMSALNNFGYRSWMPYNLVIIISILNRSLILVLILIFYPVIKDENDKKMVFILFLSFILYMLTRKFGNVARIVNYFGIIEVIVVPNIIYKLSKNKKRVVYPIFIGYLYLKLLMGLSSYYEAFVPLKIIGGIAL